MGEVPIYEYECSGCGEEHEVIQKMGARAIRKCPGCGALRLRRKISRSAFHLKGDGWYVTDYAANGKKADAKAEDGAAAKPEGDAPAKKKETAAKDDAAASKKTKGAKTKSSAVVAT